MSRIGIILAAGRGRRMGRTKQLVPWPTAEGEKPLVAAAFDAIAGVCDRMIVVLGHEADAVAAGLEDRKFERVLSDPDAQMFDSVRAGLAAAASMDFAASVLLQPGDHPQVAATTLNAILAASAACPDRVILPQYGDRGGHPLLMPASIVTRLIDTACPHGLGRFWTDHPELCWRLPVDDADVIRDVDTPDQLLQP